MNYHNHRLLVTSSLSNSNCSIVRFSIGYMMIMMMVGLLWIHPYNVAVAFVVQSSFHPSTTTTTTTFRNSKHHFHPNQQHQTTTTTTTTTIRRWASTMDDTKQQQQQQQDEPSFTSTGAQQQIGNDSFLNSNLMTRAQYGPNQRNTESLTIGIIGAGLAGMIAAMDLVDAGHQVEIFEIRPYVGGKVSSWKDKDGNHIEMGLHVFFGCYYNLFGIMKRTGGFDQHLRLKEHVHTFINHNGKTGALDFRFPIGAPVSGLQAFARTEQLNLQDKGHNAVRLALSPIVRALVDFDGGMDMVRDLDDISFTEWYQRLGATRGGLDRMWDAIAYALGFLDSDNISARCMLTIFMLFAIRTEASVLRMLDGSPQTGLHDPIVKYLQDRNVKIHLSTPCRDIVHDINPETGLPTRVRGIKIGANDEFREFDVVVAATDVPGIKKLLPENFRKYDFFDKIYNLDTVPIATVQVRFDGWVTELNDEARMMDVSGDQSNGRGGGIDNLLYSVDAEFSCFADLAVTSPGEYYKPGEGSLIQAVFDERAFSRSNDQLVKDCIKQLNDLFPSSRKLNCTWSSVVKLGQSLYREKPGQDKFRPKQATPITNFFLSGSYTYQDYLDSMEGATRSGLMVADEIIARADGPNGLKAQAHMNAVEAVTGSTVTSAAA